MSSSVTVTHLGDVVQKHTDSMQIVEDQSDTLARLCCPFSLFLIRLCRVSAVRFFSAQFQ